MCNKRERERERERERKREREREREHFCLTFLIDLELKVIITRSSKIMWLLLTRMFT